MLHVWIPYEHTSMYTHILQWRHNERHGVSNPRRNDCLLNRLFRRRSKKTSKLRVTGLCEGNPTVTGGLHSQRASNAENVSIWWRYHDKSVRVYMHHLVFCRVILMPIIRCYEAMPTHNITYVRKPMNVTINFCHFIITTYVLIITTCYYISDKHDLHSSQWRLT